MNLSRVGWITFISAIGMMCGLASSDIAKLSNWHQAVAPAFVAVLMGHFAVVILAFIGGKIIPESRNHQFTRSTDLEKNSSSINSIINR